MSEKADYYNSEPDFILDYNWLSTGYIRTQMIYTIYAWCILNDSLMIWFNFIKHKTLYDENSRIVRFTMYVKWVMGGLAYFQFKYFNFQKTDKDEKFNFKDLRLYWTFLCQLKLFINIPLKQT